MTKSIHLTRLDSKGENYIIQFSPKVEDIPLNQYFDLDVIVKGATGQNLAYSITLDVDAGMQTHNHGMNAKPVIKRIGKSRFKVEGMLLHMPGEWFIKFIVRRGLMSDSAKINLSVKL
ncbi:MAG: hypothetical protein L3J53_01050 [Proteobacteria bacterium]|nr:hypothetical protein [Pseudomonadota bacterium]